VTDVDAGSGKETVPESEQAALVGAARRGSRAALATLVTRHRPMLLALCQGALGDAGLAEDAAQEAVLVAMTNLDRLRQPERFGSWLAGIGLNVCRRWRRELSRTSWSWEALQGGRGSDRPLPGPGPAELAEAAEDARMVRAAVAALPPGRRAAVTLHYLAGLSQAETAALAGTSVGAVKVRLHKARVQLREQLGPWWKEEHVPDEAIDWVEMTVEDVRWAPAGDELPEQHVVLLAEVGGDRRLPIWVGPFEGTALAMSMQGAELPRPDPYRFAAGLLAAAGATLREARVIRLAEGTFYAEALVGDGDGEERIDARPSDALNLALLLGAPIRVDAAIFDQVAAQGPHSPEAARRLSDGAAEIVTRRRAEWERTMAAFAKARDQGT
jgi:RNA polymerase sigma factor (sigma-70 family)